MAITFYLLLFYPFIVYAIVYRVSLKHFFFQYHDSQSEFSFFFLQMAVKMATTKSTKYNILGEDKVCGQGNFRVINRHSPAPVRLLKAFTLL